MMDELPPGWTFTIVGNVTERVPSMNPSAHPNKEFGYVDISSIDNSHFVIADVKRFKGRDAPSRARRPVKPNDILFSNVRTYLRNIAIVPSDTDADLCSTGFTVLRPNAAILSQFLFRYVLSNDFIDRVTPTQTGSHYPATSDSAVFAEAIVLPPIAEQRRIVAELEQLLAKSDDCQERLSNISTCLRRFRRSVLAAACSGRLTADWREKHPNKIGIDKMLAAIRHRQETSAKTMAQKARIKDIYSVAEENDSDQLPDHWRFIRLNKLAVSFDYGTSAKSQTKGKVPVLRMGNIQNGRIDWSDLVYTSNREEILQYSLSPQTVLFNRTNSPELVGKTAIYRGERPAIFAGYLIRVNPQPELDPEYLNLCLNTSNAKEFCSSIKTDGVSQSNINAQKLGAFEVPFCSPAEQKEIVSRVEGLFGLAEKIEARYKIAQQVVDRLSQSIIAKAFRGELVPTEAELAEREGRPYESAEELLNRIRRSSKGEVGLRDAGTRTAQNPQIIDGISLDGFSEAIIIDKLRETRCAQVPEKSGIYLIIRSSVSEPHFLRKSTGGWFKGLDPSYPIKVVHENWVDGAHVMYVGMTAADGGLRSRLCQFFDFGSGKRVGHRGGRLLWHLEDSGELLVRWRTCAANKADSAETAAITSFKSVHDDRRPFANMAK